MTRRHPALVTADRLREASRWSDRFTDDQRAAVKDLIGAFEHIAEHDRTDTGDGWRCSCGASVAIPGVGKAELDRLFNDHAPAQSPAASGDSVPSKPGG